MSYSVLKGIIGPPLSVHKQKVTLISVYNTYSSYGAVLYKIKYQKLYYPTALINIPTLPFDIAP